MSWSITLGSFGGTLVRLHVTFLLLLVWLGAVFYAQGGVEAAVAGLVFIALLFTCVVLHEFGHIVAARRYGVRTPDIVLLPIGGVARLERIPEDPKEEIVVAVAGPLVNVAIAALLFVVLGFTLPQEGFDPSRPGVALVLANLFWANVILVLFNLIPAFPMDGGRVLRALLAKRMGYAQGTRVAAGIGQALAFAFGLLGLVGGNPLLLFVALFVYLAAASEGHAAQIREAAQGIRVADAMITTFRTLDRGAGLDEALDAMLRTGQPALPVVDDAKRPIGILSRDGVMAALKGDATAQNVATMVDEDVATVSAQACLDEALRELQERRRPAVVAVDKNGAVVGLVTRETLSDLFMLELARRPQHEARRSDPAPVR